MNIFQFDSEQAWINGVVSLWRDRLRVRPRSRICLTSGHTPLKIYQAMRQACAAGQVSFAQAEVFALDDFGGLAADDPGRCPSMLREYLIDGTDLPKERFHTIDTEALDLEKVCRAYDALIGPGFDLCILGIGLNGHVGLNEPGSPLDSVTRRVELHPSTVEASAKYLEHSNLPRWGVGVGLKQLLGSNELWLLANGRSKAEIVRRVVRGEISEDVPASLARRHANSFLFLDSEAAGRLVHASD